MDMTRWSIWPGEDAFFILLLLEFNVYKKLSEEMKSQKLLPPLDLLNEQYHWALKASLFHRVCVV